MVVSWRIGGRSERLVGSRLSGGLRRHRVFRFDGIWLCVQKWGRVVVTGGSLLPVWIFFFFLWGHGLGVAKVVVWLRGFSAMSRTMDNKVFVFIF